MKSYKFLVSLFVIFSIFQLQVSSGADVFDGLVADWALNEGKGQLVYNTVADSNHSNLTEGLWVVNDNVSVLSFDGEKTRVDTDVKITQDGSKGITFFAWAYPTSTSWGRHHVISSDNGGFDWSILRESGRWCVFDGNGSKRTGFNVDINKWQCVAAVFKPDENVLFYKNAVESSLGKAPGTDTCCNYLTIGDNAGRWNEYFEGIIKDVMVFERALTAQEIAQLYEMTNKDNDLKVDVDIISIDNIDLSISSKIKALELLENTIEKQQAAYGVLDEMLKQRQYFGRIESEITNTKDNLGRIIQQDKELAKNLAQSIQKLISIFESLGYTY
ncbi:MAG: LamG domain-containing protein [Anaerohalosphaeraceae bacterium]|nr:LamG domain-containing protein [Anaerohalosphaeraceae bacterium]